MIDRNKYEPLGDRAGAQCKLCGALVPYDLIARTDRHVCSEDEPGKSRAGTKKSRKRKVRGK